MDYVNTLCSKKGTFSGMPLQLVENISYPGLTEMLLTQHKPQTPGWCPPSVA